MNIKNRKLYLLSTCLFLIGITISMSSVMAWEMPIVEKSQWFTTEHGTHVSGNNDDLQTDNGVAVHWRGDFEPGFLPWESVWIVEVHIGFNVPARSYSNVYLEVDFQFSGNSDLRIIVFYTQGHDEFYESSTGDYVYCAYLLDPYKKVVSVTFYCATSIFGGIQQNLYIDYLSIMYSNFM